jgi:hypothetical protein
VVEVEVEVEVEVVEVDVVEDVDAGVDEVVAVSVLVLAVPLPPAPVVCTCDPPQAASRPRTRGAAVRSQTRSGMLVERSSRDAGSLAVAAGPTLAQRRDATLAG